MLALADEQMRAAGLSANKTASLRDLAAKVLDGTVIFDPHRLAREPDYEVVSQLTAVRGIGSGRLRCSFCSSSAAWDVWPAGDLGVRKGYGLAWGVPMPTPKQLSVLGEPFRPYPSVAAWYCWRAAEIYAEAAESAVTGQPVPDLRTSGSWWCTTPV